MPRKAANAQADSAGAAGGVSKKGGGGRDEGEPKRPLSAYFFWLGERRAGIAEQYELKGAAVLKKAGELWRNMADEDKKKYDELAVKAKADYEAKMKAYNRLRDRNSESSDQ